jgi:hypothetical protein
VNDGRGGDFLFLPIADDLQHRGCRSAVVSAFAEELSAGFVPQLINNVISMIKTCRVMKIVMENGMIYKL